MKNVYESLDHNSFLHNWNFMNVIAPLIGQTMHHALHGKSKQEVVDVASEVLNFQPDRKSEILPVDFDFHEISNFTKSVQLGHVYLVKRGFYMSDLSPKFTFKIYIDHEEDIANYYQLYEVTNLVHSNYLPEPFVFLNLTKYH